MLQSLQNALKKNTAILCFKIFPGMWKHEEPEKFVLCFNDKLR